MQRAAPAPDSPDHVSPDEVRSQLSQILSSSHFVASQRLCRFLTHVVERALERDTERLKEFVVAIEVFDRKEDYDPNIDSIVRVEARRLRTKLKAYYEREGVEDRVLIGLRPGSYVPLFQIASRAQPAVTPPSPIVAAYTSVAVLPFANMSPEPEQDYFCDGVTEEILNALGRIENVVVVARTSSFQFKGQHADVREIGAKLGAQVVVEGSVRKSGSQLRVTAQAVDSAKGYNLWSETYRRELKDVFAVQEEIAASVAKAMQAKLPGMHAGAPAYRPPIAAYESFLKGQSLVYQQSVPALHAAMDQFRELTRAYPEYAEPYAGLATGYAALSLFGIVSGRQIEADLRGNAETAVRLDPESADAWTVMGGISAHWDFQWAEAERRFMRAIGMQPSSFAARSWYGMVLCMLGRFDEAEAQLGVGIRLNPLSPSSYGRLATLAYVRGDHMRALDLLKHAMAPEFPDSRFILALVHIRRGEYGEAVEALSRDLDTMPIPVHLGLLAGAYYRWGKVREAERVRAKLEEMAQIHYITPLARACAAVGSNDLDGAFKALNDAVADRIIFVNMVNVDPYFEPVRQDHRYGVLRKTLNLT